MQPEINLSNIDFNGSIFGFESLRYFALEKVEGNHPFFLLKSKEREEFEFVVISPFEVDQKYEFQLTEDLARELRIESPHDVLVFSIMNVRKPFEESTVNMIAPLIINVIHGLARQIILNGSPYQAQSRLFPIRNEGA
ncbi:flagellar assembly protein FliW [Cohnella thermotolerans]|uniref:flagellar assembly protein FliW n=1 Tax=Cohnella thermotolerans TaxID=329858 RepID=UPI0006865573|nr:flagellar assembly protein FliW [Cohnella thermotolerans]